jgi:hypothetical protein
VVGQAPHGLNTAFHPVLNLGVTNVYGKSLTLFQGRSLATTGKIDLPSAEERRPSLLTFGGRGTKVVLWNGENAAAEQGLQLIRLPLTDADRAALAKAYGRP